MDALEAILTRRSIRSYEGRPVSDDIMEQLLRAGTSAPSAGNEQPWHFITIDDRNILCKIPTIHPYAQMLEHAPAAILVCGDPGLELYKGFMVQDVSAATQNILVAARACGLASVWLGIHPTEEREEKFRVLFGIPAHIVPFSLIALGYSSEVQKPADRFRSDRMHTNAW